MTVLILSPDEVLINSKSTCCFAPINLKMESLPASETTLISSFEWPKTFFTIGSPTPALLELPWPVMFEIQQKPFRERLQSVNSVESLVSWSMQMSKKL